MALIACPECKHQVSDTATSCPNCGTSIADAESSKATGTPLLTIQETSKKLKMQIIISSIMFWVGLFMAFSYAQAIGEDSSPTIPAFMMLIGLIWYLITRFRIWWHHK